MVTAWPEIARSASLRNTHPKLPRTSETTLNDENRVPVGRLRAEFVRGGGGTANLKSPRTGKADTARHRGGIGEGGKRTEDGLSGKMSGRPQTRGPRNRPHKTLRTDDDEKRRAHTQKVDCRRIVFLPGWKMDAFQETLWVSPSSQSHGNLNPKPGLVSQYSTSSVVPEATQRPFRLSVSSRGAQTQTGEPPDGLGLAAGDRPFHEPKITRGVVLGRSL